MSEVNVYQRMFEREREARKQAEELLETMSLELYDAYSQLKKSSDEVFAIFRSVTDGIVTFNQAGTIESLNPAIERIFGYSENVLKGQDIRVLLPSNELEFEFELDDTYWVDRCSEAQPKFATQGINAQGQIFDMELSASKSSQSGKDFYVWVIRNTSKIRNVERKLAVSQRLEAIGQLAAGLSHEINTPIQYVHENVKFLRDAFKATEEVLARVEREFSSAGSYPTPGFEESFRQICSETQWDFFRKEIPVALYETLYGSKRVTSIVQAIRDFAHPGASEMSTLDLNKAITSAVTLAANHWRTLGEIVTDFDRSLPKITCHVSEINQVILNLLINACDAIAEARAANPSRLGKIVFKTWQEGNMAKLSISDSGVGIKRENLERIFTLFFTTKAVGKGTGQGLAIAHSIVVERHNGNIDVFSQLGEGATFIVSLPIQPLEDVPPGGVVPYEGSE